MVPFVYLERINLYGLTGQLVGFKLLDLKQRERTQPKRRKVFETCHCLISHKTWTFVIHTVYFLLYIYIYINKFIALNFYSALLLFW